MSTPRRSGRPVAPTELREGIVATALGLLLSSPDVEQVTIARITEAAGCTPPTLYHYWPSRSALLLEASARGWETFRSSQAIAPGSPDPQERLRARGQAYLRFAITHPELFRVLFLSRSEEVERGSALDDLIDDVAAAIDEGHLFGDAGQLALGLWATAHGVAALAYANPPFAEHAPALLDQLTDRLLARPADKALRRAPEDKS